MFKFNFFGNASTDTNTDTILEPTIAPLPPRKLAISSQPGPLPASEPVTSLPGLLRRSLSSSSPSPFPRDTDVITGVYEGGFKTWECSVDLAQYLRSQEMTGVSRVLEVGCGSALPSITAKKLNPSLHLTLQDYNDSVLQECTAVNLQLNGFRAEECEFWCGDWEGLSAALRPSQPFDLILTSETIYRPPCYAALLRIFSGTLGAGGRVLVAAKDYYFGLGGSVEEFSARAGTEGWAVQRVWQHAEGVPRSILELRRIA